MNPRVHHVVFASVHVLSNRGSERKCSVAPCNIIAFSKFLSFTSPGQSWLKSFVAVILASDRPIWSSRHLSNRRSSFARALRSCPNISLFASLFCLTLSSCYLVILLCCYLVTSSVMQPCYLACLLSSSSLLPSFILLSTSHRGSILAQPESLNVILADRFLLNFELVMPSFRSP